jgi:demethylmenaquinone methyltransferase/2-methoxy-6-polyprenyl-1,4-benzoquinol methylase
MFSRIAPSYDRLNRTMTFGLDQGWRRHVVEQVAPPVQGRALDVGTGTGDFLPLLAAWAREGLTVGVDFALPMMQNGVAKIEHLPHHAAFVNGDALCLPFPDNCFDAITTGFVMRNVTHIRAAFREMWRVARPGGAVACLEVAQPRNPLLRLGHWLYFQQVVPALGGLLSGDSRAYRYLPQSARRFPPPPALAELMRQAGWSEVRYRLVGFGAAAIHVAVKQ